MITGRSLLVAVLFVWNPAGHAAATAPVATFDLDIQQRIGPQASVVSLVVRDSHLYFLCSGFRESVVVETGLDGTFQHLTQTGVQRLANFDADDQGYLYMLSEDSWLTVFHPNGGIQRTAHLEPKILALALVDGKPMVADEKDRLHFLETEGPNFTLSAWPRPWRLLGIGFNQLAIWRPEGKTISVMQGEEVVSTRRFGETEHYIAAAGDGNKRLFMLSADFAKRTAQVQEFDDRVRPGWIRSLALPAAFSPKIMGVSGSWIYLVDVSGKAAVYPLDSPSNEKALADDDPELLTDLTKLQDAIKRAGHTGRVSIQLTVETDGLAHVPQIHEPAYLSNHPGVIAAIQALRFRPKMQGGSTVAVSMILELNQ